MEPKYGKDYGIKVDVPWYIKCPLINRLFDTCLVEILLTTFTSDGAPLTGVVGKFRIPIKKSSIDISTLLNMSFAFPTSGIGLIVEITLLDVNHKEVLSITEDIPLGTSFNAFPRWEKVRFGKWQDLCIDLKFGNRDYYEI